MYEWYGLACASPDVYCEGGQCVFRERNRPLAGFVVFLSRGHIFSESTFSVPRFPEIITRSAKNIMRRLLLLECEACQYACRSVLLERHEGISSTTATTAAELIDMNSLHSILNDRIRKVVRCFPTVCDREKRKACWEEGPEFPQFFPDSHFLENLI